MDRSIIVRAALSLAMGTIAVAVSPLPAAAECDGPVPSFREALASARRVVIGDVIGVSNGGGVNPATNDGWSSRFTLEVLYTPVGGAPPTMEIDDLPTQPCAGVVQVRRGDRIALALDATAFTPRMRVNTVAWIRGTRPHTVGIERITTAEVFRLLGMNIPDTATLPDQPGNDAVRLLIAAISGALAGALAWRRASTAKRPCRARGAPR
jgi:hypothetical protein